MGVLAGTAAADIMFTCIMSKLLNLISEDFERAGISCRFDLSAVARKLGFLNEEFDFSLRGPLSELQCVE